MGRNTKNEGLTPTGLGSLLKPREGETIVVRRALRNAVRRIDEQIPLADIASFR